MKLGSSRGAQAVEFAIVLPVLLLLICGFIDFGFTFGGFLTMEHGVQDASRAASVNATAFSGGTCTGGPDINTANLVCNVASDIGSVTGVNTSNLSIGVCFFTPGSGTPSCSSGTTGTSGSMDVEICAQATLHSTTGLMGPFLNSRTVSTSSRLLIEQPQPSGPTAYAAFSSSSPAVTYRGTKVNGMSCPSSGAAG